VTKKIATAVDESVSKQQKEFFLRQQLAAIQRELNALQRGSSSSSPTAADATGGGNSGGDGSGSGSGSGLAELNDDEQNEADDMAELKRKIEAMGPGSEERKMGVREWKRLKRIPQGSVKHSVIRSYVCYSLLLSLYTTLTTYLFSLNGSRRYHGPTLRRLPCQQRRYPRPC
jgi:ATP-dependent Lon protease